MKSLIIRIQAVVDTCAFWLMRRGVPKAMQLYVLTAIWIAVGMAETVYEVQVKGSPWTLLVWGGAASALWAYTLHHSTQFERDAESAGINTGGHVPWVVRALGLALLAGAPLFATWNPWGEHTFELVSHVVVISVTCVEIFVMHTPNTPPPEKLKMPARAVPA